MNDSWLSGKLRHVLQIEEVGPFLNIPSNFQVLASLSAGSQLNISLLLCIFVTPVGVEPTMDLRHQIKSLDRSASTGTESFVVVLVGFEPTMWC